MTEPTLVLARPVGVRPLFLASVLVAVVVFVTSSPPAAGQTNPSSSACVECHLSLENQLLAAPARSFPDDVHSGVGFGCTACHGGGVAGQPAPHEPDAGFLTVPARQEVPTMCGRCHSDAAFMRGYDPGLRVDQVAEYLTSVHGRLLMESDDPDVATCVSCHPAHNIRPPDDPDSSVHPSHVAELCGSCHANQALMERRGHTFDELQNYRTSVHARLLYEEGDLSAPTCNDCHGNHGAAPPGTASVRNVCGQCHATMAEYFAASGHVEPFDVDQRPGCATCHGNHAIQEPDEQTLTARSVAVCEACHSDAADPHGGEFLVMRAFIDSLSVARERAGAILEEAENRGMEVSEAIFGLEDVNNSLTLARSAVHSFHVGPVAGALQPGFEVAHSAWDSGLEALDEHRYRRVGLALSFAVILFLIVGLLLKIRESGSGPRSEASFLTEGPDAPPPSGDEARTGSDESTEP